MATIKRTLGRVKSPAILVGHSYGGATITGAGRTTAWSGWFTLPPSPRMSARPCRASSTSTRRKYSAMSRSQTGAPGCCRQASSILRETFPRRSKKLVWATHYAPAADLLQQQKLDRTPWKSKPSWFIVAKNDRTVHPDLERFLAKRMGATVVEADSSHVIMLSKPDVVIDVIRKAVAAVQKS